MSCREDSLSSGLFDRFRSEVGLKLYIEYSEKLIYDEGCGWGLSSRPRGGL